MARNIEIKARIENVEAMAVKVAALADHGPIDIVQDDTFFVCKRGRVKLRVVSPTAGQLIFYQRANQAGPKESVFVSAPTASPDALCETLSLAYGQAGRVRKHRTLYRVGKTRIHLDRVEHLGDFWLTCPVLLVLMSRKPREIVPCALPESAGLYRTMRVES